jgi:competence protein ComGC
MKSTNKAFTRVELLFALMGVAIVTLPAVSLLATNNTQSQQNVCLNNLRQIGRGFQIWASDHGDRFPWRTPVAEGGIQGHALAANLWFQFDWISNSLASPSVFVCPADPYTKRVADNWGFQPGGLVYVGYQNNAVSYFIGLHAQPYSGQSLLCGDSDMKVTARNQGCSVLTQPVCRSLSGNDNTVGWTNLIHVAAGNLLLADGSVHLTSSRDLRAAVQQAANDDNGSGIHLLSK